MSQPGTHPLTGDPRGQAPAILILDTTLRDGEQTQGVSFSPEQMLHIAKALLELVRVQLMGGLLPFRPLSQRPSRLPLLH